MSSHHTLHAAHKRRAAFECVREGSLVKGAAFLRVYESMCARIEANDSHHKDK